MNRGTAIREKVAELNLLQSAGDNTERPLVTGTFAAVGGPGASGLPDDSCRGRLSSVGSKEAATLRTVRPIRSTITNSIWGATGI